MKKKNVFRYCLLSVCLLLAISFSSCGGEEENTREVVITLKGPFGGNYAPVNITFNQADHSDWDHIKKGDKEHKWKLDYDFSNDGDIFLLIDIEDTEDYTASLKVGKSYVEKDVKSEKISRNKQRITISK